MSSEEKEKEKEKEPQKEMVPKKRTYDETITESFTDPDETSNLKDLIKSIRIISNNQASYETCEQISSEILKIFDLYIKNDKNKRTGIQTLRENFNKKSKTTNEKKLMIEVLNKITQYIYLIHKKLSIFKIMKMFQKEPKFDEEMIKEIPIVNLLIFYGIAFKKETFYQHYFKQGNFEKLENITKFSISYYDWICFFEEKEFKEIQEKMKDQIKKQIEEKKFSTKNSILIHFSTSSKNAPMVKALIEDNLNKIDDKDIFGYTALEWSHVYCVRDTIEYLTSKYEELNLEIDEEKILKCKLEKQTESTVKESIGLDGLSLKYAIPRLRNNFEIVKNAVWQNGFALEFAEDVLKDNEEIVSIAIRSSPFVLKFASKRLQEDESMREKTIQSGASSLSLDEDTQRSKRHKT